MTHPSWWCLPGESVISLTGSHWLSLHRQASAMVVGDSFDWCSEWYLSWVKGPSRLPEFLSQACCFIRTWTCPRFQTESARFSECPKVSCRHYCELILRPRGSTSIHHGQPPQGCWVTWPPSLRGLYSVSLISAGCGPNYYYTWRPSSVHSFDRLLWSAPSWS
jgi:hypothetical protein